MWMRALFILVSNILKCRSIAMDHGICSRCHRKGPFRFKTDLVQVCLASAIALVIAISVAQVGTSPS